MGRRKHWGSHEVPALARTRGLCPETGKIRYDSRRDARKQRRRADRGLSAYECAHCEKWHLGHLGESVKRGQIDRDTIRAMPRCAVHNVIAWPTAAAAREAASWSANEDAERGEPRRWNVHPCPHGGFHTWPEKRRTQVEGLAHADEQE